MGSFKEFPRSDSKGLDTMVKVPAGWFIMGGEKYENEKPRRRVYLDKFFIDKYPVTNVRFRRFGEPKRDHGSRFNGARQPVMGVTWYQARDYCGSVGKRLPTVAEWEKTARGVDGRKYPWGNQWDSYKVIWWKNRGGKTHPVDRTYNTHRSPIGAVDMSGNGSEWVADWYDESYYRHARERNPKGPSGSGLGRVVRGGYCGLGRVDARIACRQENFRAANRSWYPPGDGNGALGFRCAKAP